MATAPNVIPRNKVTWESPKKERKTQWRLPLTALVLAISTAQPLFSLKIRGTKTQTTIPSECLLGGCVLFTPIGAFRCAGFPRLRS